MRASYFLVAFASEDVQCPVVLKFEVPCLWHRVAENSSYPSNLDTVFLPNVPAQYVVVVVALLDPIGRGVLIGLYQVVDDVQFSGSSSRYVCNVSIRTLSSC